jgi:REP element-mobilizing transposase RayT
MKTNIPPLHPDSYYHIYNRGVNGENLFKEERNYTYFLKRYDLYVSQVADTFAYCLLKNHFHILIRTRPEKDLIHLKKALPAKGSSFDSFEEIDFSKILSNAFASLFKSYAQSINKAHGRTGALFEEPFRRIEVKTESYFSLLVHYIHLNPQAHGFVDDFKDYPHSSYNSLVSEKETKLIRNEVLEWFGGRVNFTAFHENLPLSRLPSDLLLDL